MPLRAAGQRDPISAGGAGRGRGGARFCLGLSWDAPSPPATKWPSNQPPEGMVRAHFLVPLRRGLPRPWGCPVFHSSPKSPRTIWHSAGGHVSSVFQVELRGEGARGPPARKAELGPKQGVRPTPDSRPLNHPDSSAETGAEGRRLGQPPQAR